MRYPLVLVLALLPACVLADTSPRKGANIPGPFTVYNVTGPGIESKDKLTNRYRSPVTENGLNPVVMVVVRGIEVKQPGLKALLVKLDNAVDKNPNTRLASFVVFLSNTLKDVAKDDTEREALEPKVEDIARQPLLKHLTLCLDAPARLAAWKLDPDADVVVILYKDLRTVDVHNLKWEQLMVKEPGDLPAKVKEVLDEVRKEFGATR